ncbi:nucleoid-associated protein YejK [Billgrantia endophytica]|uniref:Nucleoid-associated protein YejK n=1 Tax=Billgrantia endophytica TaxID=2033802 RepID=A0A2N7U444_9GAMM|nr:nucleoid-associated protein YejK [Halomonas endophytica]PMR75189.1 nucleoid-associated protein YejK [Halomonas endophytica]
MPILHSIIHRIDKASGDQPAVLKPASDETSPSDAQEGLLSRFNDAYHAKPKAWGHFGDTTDSDDSQEEKEGAPASLFARELIDYLDGRRDFPDVTRGVAERIVGLVNAHLSVTGHLLFVDFQHGDTRYLSLALLHHREGYGIDGSLDVVPAHQLNLAQMSLAARINLSQWRSDTPSRQYLSWTRDRGGKKLAEEFATLLGATEGVDATGETRTLLKAFSDYVEQEDYPEEQSREKTDTLLDYASEQARRGEPMTLEALSELLDEQQPKAFYDHIRNADYGLSPEIPPDKRTLSQFRRFTGRASGVSISFDSHLLGSSIEYDEDQDRLIIKKVPSGLRDQIKQRQN